MNSARIPWTPCGLPCGHFGFAKCKRHYNPASICFLVTARGCFPAGRGAPCALRHISQVCRAFPACQKPQESARGGVLSHVHHFRRRVENPSGFQAGEIASCTSGTGRFLRRGTPFSRAKTGESGRFCGFAKGKTVTGQIENARRGAQRGRYSPSTNLSKILF